MDYDKVACNSFVRINLDAIASNLQTIQNHIGKDMGIIPILKGNAYGFGITELAAFLTQKMHMPMLAVAQVWEALQIIDFGVKADFYIIGGVPFRNIPMVVEHDMITPAYDVTYLQRLNAAATAKNMLARVKIKVETGLNRVGVTPGEQLEQLMDAIDQLPHIQVIGAFTHFASAEVIDSSFTLEQAARFKEALPQIKARNYQLDYVHSFNSGAITWLKDYEHMTHVRTANLVFGYDMIDQPHHSLELIESASWHAYVTHVKDVPPGESVGYSRIYPVTSPIRVATVSAGYGDGFPRHYAVTGKAEMLIRGRRAQVIAIAMDQTMLDVTGLEVEIDDLVTIYGSDGDEKICMREIQERSGLSYQSATVSISQRVPRFFTGG